MLGKLKSVVEGVPEPLGRALVRVPFSWRLGHSYSRAQSDIARYTQFGAADRQNFILSRVRLVVERALATNAFYRWFYCERGFSMDRLRSFQDLTLIPIVTKADLRNWEIERRSSKVRSRFRVNTGGTSGEPLEFFSTRDVFAHEWAHMHSIWARLGYRQTDLKLTFRGKNTGVRPVRYNLVHNELVVSAYHPLPQIGAQLMQLLRTRTVRYLHGYPSRLYEFAAYCLREAPDLLSGLRGTLRGILLGSEFPAPMYRDVIERAFPVPTVSWYGHSEMAVLAAEVSNRYEYVPMQTYGYAESLLQADGTHRLIGTSYVNCASPFIRYDTGDEVAPTYHDGVLQSFRMTSGRTGDFVVDREGRRISLTALIFGRHHEAFGRAEFIQVRQPSPGRMAVLVVPSAPDAVPPAAWSDLFDFAGVDLEVEFDIRKRPVRTPAGKVPLLVTAAHESVGVG